MNAYKNVHDESKKPLSSLDIKHYLGDNANVLVYDDLLEYDSIMQLLPKKKDFAVILFRTAEDYGHWITLIRNGNNILHYDPYGNRPDRIMEWNSAYMNRSLGQDFPQLSYLLNNALDEGFRVTFNETQYQKRSDHSFATCGRWCVSVNLYYLRNKNPTLKGFYDMIMQLCNAYELVPDLVITKIIPI